mgnify:CR=1 FL=1
MDSIYNLQELTRVRLLGSFLLFLLVLLLLLLLVLLFLLLLLLLIFLLFCYGNGFILAKLTLCNGAVSYKKFASLGGRV